MKLEPAICEDSDAEAEAAADTEGLRDFAEGRMISHEGMTAWLDSWGTSDELPLPEVGD